MMPPFQSHSDTSAAAAEAIASISGRLRQQVYLYILGLGEKGATDEEVQDALGMAGSTERPRRVELQDAGLVYDSEQRRPTRSGRGAVVWVARLKKEDS